MLAYGIASWSAEDLLLQIAKLPKDNSKRGRIVVITQGADPTIVAHDGKVLSIQTLPLYFHLPIELPQSRHGKTN